MEQNTEIITIKSEVCGIARAIKNMGNAFVLITDDCVDMLYGAGMLTSLRNHGLTVEHITFPAGEENKTREVKVRIEDEMFARGLGRDTCVIGMGGGVVTDMSGFVAATYCRKVPHVFIPTTLLAMVDAAIGGKTGVDVPAGKNLVGAFHDPMAVFIDSSFLATLSNEEFLNGIVETIKHGVVGSLALFAFLEDNAEAILRRDDDIVDELIAASMKVKLDVIAVDACESGMRRMLNFGHTMGHAYEVCSKYGVSHGRAVSMGMAAEAAISMRMGMLPADAFMRIMALLQTYGLPCHPDVKYDAKVLMEAMSLDKKAICKKVRIVAIKDIGSVDECNGEYCLEINRDVYLGL